MPELETRHCIAKGYVVAQLKSQSPDFNGHQNISPSLLHSHSLPIFFFITFVAEYDVNFHRFNCQTSFRIDLLTTMMLLPKENELVVKFYNYKGMGGLIVERGSSKHMLKACPSSFVILYMLRHIYFINFGSTNVSVQNTQIDAYLVTFQNLVKHNFVCASYKRIVTDFETCR